jgi:EAL domain-containing protein (putative c-di-GMP-specific phosphodiesterase class I)
MWRRLKMHEPWRGVLLNERPDHTVWWAYDEIWPIECGAQTIGYWARMRDLMSKTAAEPISLSIDWGILTLSPVFQPVVFADTGKILGYEALIRPQLGARAISPDTLFEMADATNTVKYVDMLCLEATAAIFRDGDPCLDNLRLSLNVRTVTLADTEWFNAFLDRLPLARTNVVVEVSEKDPLPSNFETWADLRRPYSGVLWALDDWGSGQNDIARLIELTPEWVKIDRSWLLAASSQPIARELLQQFTGWAETAGMHVVLEGVETAEDAALCTAMGIRTGQGYYWGRPAPWKTHKNSLEKH